MKILVLGAGGIIGSHMRLTQPPGIDAIYTRRVADAKHVAWEYGDGADSLHALLGTPNTGGWYDAIINLCGENRPDVVERNPARYQAVNVDLPSRLSYWCVKSGAHLVQVSTQAVFGGMPQFPRDFPASGRASFDPPYAPDSPRVPVNHYGRHKLQAEMAIAAASKRWTVVRPTFVLGVRPDPSYGRENPVEQMLAPVQAIAEGETTATQRQVCDRWFSVSFAWDVAARLWDLALSDPLCTAVHVGIPYRTNRHIIASYLRPDITIEAVPHDAFEGLAPRAIDTTYAGEGTFAEIAEGLDRCAREYAARELVTK